MTGGSLRRGAFCSNPLIHLGVIAIIGLIAYSNTFLVNFQFDDHYFITANPVITDFKYYLHPSLLQNRDGTLYSALIHRFVAYLTFTANYWLHGYNVFGYHLVNLVIHISNAFLVYILVHFASNPEKHEPDEVNQQSTGPEYFIPLAVALIFVSHPIQTEAVTYIYQRLTSLVALFYLLAISLYIQARRLQTCAKSSSFASQSLYIVSIISAVLAMKTKENAFTFPIMISLYEVMFLKWSWKKRLRYLSPFYLTMSIIPLSLLKLNSTLNDAMRMETDMSRLDYFYTQFKVVVTYLRLLLVPVGLNIDHDVQVSHSLFEGSVAGGALILSMCLGLGLYFTFQAGKNKYYRLIGFGILWFFITISIESSFIPIKDLMFEHRMYLPSVGALLSLTAAAILLMRQRTIPEWFQHVALCAVVTTAVIMTFNRNITWQSGISLWADSARKSPLKARPHANLGQQYLDAGLLDQSLEPLWTAIRLKPDYKEAIYNLGIVYGKKGMYAESLQCFNKTLALTEAEKSPALPDKASIHFQLGVVNYLNKSPETAMAHYFASLRLNPDNPRLYYNMGLAEKDPSKAERYFREALRLKPDYPAAYQNLLAILNKNQANGAARTDGNGTKHF